MMMIPMSLAAAVTTMTAAEARCAAGAADLLGSVAGVPPAEAAGIAIVLSREDGRILVTANLPQPQADPAQPRKPGVPPPPPPILNGGVGHFVCDARGRIVASTFEK